MRYYLDTNILIFSLFGSGKSDLSTDTLDVLADYSTVKLTSTVCVHELIHLCQIGKITKPNNKKPYRRYGKGGNYVYIPRRGNRPCNPVH